jgi:type II secretory pathway pseudopilin PulG
MIDITTVIEAVLALIGALITAFLIPWIKNKTGAEKLEQIELWVTVAVEAAEQIYTGSGKGAQKKAYVLEFLNSKGFDLDWEEIDMMIESAVFNLPAYFAVAETEADSGGAEVNN